MRSVERQLQRSVNNLQKWADENGFRFSETKTVSMHFCNLRRLHPEPLLKIYNVNIPVVKETKFLGLTFDSKLSFIPHLKNLRARCLKALNLIRVVAHKDWGVDCDTLLKLYRCLIRSKLDYGSIVYSSAYKSYIQMLDPIQNQAVRLCLGAFRTSLQKVYKLKLTSHHWLFAETNLLYNLLQKSTQILITQLLTASLVQNMN